MQGIGKLLSYSAACVTQFTQQMQGQQSDQLLLTLKISSWVSNAYNNERKLQQDSPCRSASTKCRFSIRIKVIPLAASRDASDYVADRASGLLYYCVWLMMLFCTLSRRDTAESHAQQPRTALPWLRRQCFPQPVWNHWGRLEGYPYVNHTAVAAMRSSVTRRA